MRRDWEPVGLEERLARRNNHCAVYALPGPPELKKRRLFAHSKGVNYWDSTLGNWRRIRPDFGEFQPGQWEMTSHRYRVAITDQAVGFRIEKRGGEWARVRLVQINGTNVGDIPSFSVNPELGQNDRVRFRSMIPNVLDGVFSVGMGACETSHRYNRRQPLTLGYTVTVSGDLADWDINTEPSGWDNFGGPPRPDVEFDGAMYPQPAMRRLRMTKSPRVIDEDAQGNTRLFFTEHWDGYVGIESPDGTVTWTNDPAEIELPLFIRPPDIDVAGTAAESGDEKSDTGAWTSAATSRIGSAGSPSFHFGIWWQNVALPAAPVTIDNGNFLHAITAGATVRDLGYWYFDATDSAVAFDTVNLPTDRTPTTASHVWPQVSPAENLSFSITASVQEIADRPGRVSGDDWAGIILADADTDWDQNTILTGATWLTQTSPRYPHLEIDYTTGGGSLPPLNDSRRHKMILQH